MKYKVEKRINQKPEMKRAEKFIEVEALIENLMKSRRSGGVLRMKILLFCSIYENLSVSMIIEKLGIKKTNFALMTSGLEKEGCIKATQSNMDRRCHQIELTPKGREELNHYLNEVETGLGATTMEVDSALEVICKYLNRVI